MFKAAHSQLRFKTFLQEISKASERSETLLMDQLSVRVAPDAMEAVFKSVPMCGTGGRAGGNADTETADIRAWYNATFLPRVEGDQLPWQYVFHKAACPWMSLNNTSPYYGLCDPKCCMQPHIH